MAPVRGARYNIRRKFDNAPAEEHNGESEETNVQQRQSCRNANPTKAITTPTTAISHHTFPHAPALRTDLLYIATRRRTTNATPPKHPPAASTTTCSIMSIMFCPPTAPTHPRKYCWPPPMVPPREKSSRNWRTCDRVSRLVRPSLRLLTYQLSQPYSKLVTFLSFAS